MGRLQYNLTSQNPKHTINSQSHSQSVYVRGTFDISNQSFIVLSLTTLKTTLFFCLKQLQDILEVLVHASSRYLRLVVLTLRMLQTPASKPKALLA